MQVEGDPSRLSELLFPNGLIPQIITLIVETWPKLAKPCDDEDEPKITHRFVKLLDSESRAKRLRLRIQAHVKELEMLNEATGKGFGEIDIHIPHGYDTRCYFAIEAKKLNTLCRNGRRVSGAGAYVGEEGLICFITGKYGKYQSEAGMLGYVMDGNCTKAKERITHAIERRADDLGIPRPVCLSQSAAIPSDPAVFETQHTVARGPLKVHHILVAV